MNENTINARQLYNKNLRQDYIEEKQFGVFDLIDEINRSQKGNWIFNYIDNQDIITTTKEILLNFDKSSFVDEYPPDGKTIIKGETYRKEWKIRNDGNAPWIGRKMKTISIHRGLKPHTDCIEMPIVYPGQEYSLIVEYVAYVEGTYESVWKMYDENDSLIYPELYGLWLTTKIVV